MVVHEHEFVPILKENLNISKFNKDKRPQKSSIMIKDEYDMNKTIS